MAFCILIELFFNKSLYIFLLIDIIGIIINIYKLNFGHRINIKIDIPIVVRIECYHCTLTKVVDDVEKKGYSFMEVIWAFNLFINI